MKYGFFTNNINYHGHVIRPRKVEISLHTGDVIKQVIEPRIVIEIRSFSGLCNVFGGFVSNLIRIAAPLNRIFQKDQQKDFGPLNDNERRAVKHLPE